MTVYLRVWHSHCTRARFTVLVFMQWPACSSRMHGTDLRSFDCRGRWSNLRMDCSIVGLYCLSITWQQAFQGSLQVTIGVLSHATIERRHFW